MTRRPKKDPPCSVCGKPVPAPDRPAVGPMLCDPCQRARQTAPTLAKL